MPLAVAITQEVRRAGHHLSHVDLAGRLRPRTGSAPGGPSRAARARTARLAHRRPAGTGTRNGPAGGASNRPITRRFSCRPITTMIRSRWTGGTTFHFVTEGFDAAYSAACETAGESGVDIAGGASTVRQALIAGVIEELTLDIAPVLLGSGERIFDGIESFGFEPAEVLHSPLATTSAIAASADYAVPPTAPFRGPSFEWQVDLRSCRDTGVRDPSLSAFVPADGRRRREQSGDPRRSTASRGVRRGPGRIGLPPTRRQASHRSSAAVPCPAPRGVRGGGDQVRGVVGAPRFAD